MNELQDLGAPATYKEKTAVHCECPLNGGLCCYCGVFECEVPSELATRHNDQWRQISDQF